KIRSIPHKVLVTPKKLARLLPRCLHHAPLGARGLLIEFNTQSVEAYSWQTWQVILDPCVLSRSRESRDHRHPAGEILMREIVRVTNFRAEILEAAMGGREGSRRVQTAAFSAQLFE